jgi:outer membrane immunogenic protein
MIRISILGAVGVVALISSANASDLYRAPAGGFKDAPYAYAPVSLWSGFYAGVNGGGGWSDSSDHLALLPYSSGLYPEGAFGGGQVGYNWQGFWHPNLVLGIEADIQGADLSDSATDARGDKVSTKLDYFGSVRGRLGYASGRALVYATGGFAYGGIKNEGYGLSNDGTATGYTVGGGFEYKVAPAWSIKTEYQYMNLGKNEPVDGGVTYSDLGGDVREDAFHTIRFGLNYHLLPAAEYAPLK